VRIRRDSVSRVRCATALAVALALASSGAVPTEANGPFLLELGAGGHDTPPDTIVTSSGTIWVGWMHPAVSAGDHVSAAMTISGAPGPMVDIAVPATTMMITSGSFSFDPPMNGWAVGSYRVDVALNGAVFASVMYSVH
jgi:hypothetical protein